MRTKLIIARHGNTFSPGETPTRVGAKTDLPLVEEGIKAGKKIGEYLHNHNLTPDAVYAAPLLRTMQTAGYAISAFNIKTEILKLEEFTEIDYGPDENKTEEEVMVRLGNGNSDEGKKIIDEWNKNAIVPEGWKVDPKKIIKTWEDFANDPFIKGKTILLVTSNGILRFSPYLTGDFETFTATHKIKVAPGNLCIFEKEDNDTVWTCTAWNIKP